MCTPEFIEYVCDLLSPLGVVSSRKMMGDYVIYVDGKCAIIACDGICYVKKLPELSNLMAEAEVGCPYEGAKEHYILDVEHRDSALKVVGILRDVLPYPKKKK